MYLTYNDNVLEHPCLHMELVFHQLHSTMVTVFFSYYFYTSVLNIIICLNILETRLVFEWLLSIFRFSLPLSPFKWLLLVIIIQTYITIQTHDQFDLKGKLVFINASEKVLVSLKTHHSCSNSFHTAFTITYVFTCSERN